MQKAILPLHCSAIILSLSLFSTPLSAHETGRYSMLETKNGIVRLDKQTGAMATCKTNPEENGWDCTPLADNALTTTTDNETIKQLRRENLKLKQQLANKFDKESFKPSESEKQFKFPNDEEIDQSIEYMEKMIRKFRDAMKRLKDEHGTPDQEL